MFETFANLERRPWGALWVFLILALAIDGGFVVWCAAFGHLEPVLFSSRDPLELALDGRIHLVLGALMAFLLTARRNEINGMRRELVVLRPLTECTEAEFDALAAPLQHVARDRWRLIVGFGVVVGCLLVPLTSKDPLGYLAAFYIRWELWDAHFVWATVSNILMLAVLALGVLEHRARKRVLDAVAARLTRIDLLDRRPLASFARQGLRSAFQWAGASSILSLVTLGLENVWPLLILLVITLAMATLAFLAPVQSIRRRLVEAKRSELDRLRREIARARDSALKDGEQSAEQSARLPGLLAYEARIESVRAWPFDPSVLWRFAALALLATGSWLGGAVVERLLGLALD